MWVVLILWLIVLPVELIQFVIRYELLPTDSFSGIVRSLWVVGFLTATTLITSSSLLLRVVIVLLGLIIATPAYFVIGALLNASTRMGRFLGLLLFVVKLMAGYFLMRAFFYA